MNLQTVNANVARVPFFRFLNFEVQSMDDFHAEAEMTFEAHHIGNPIMEHYHGGIIASFMEATAAIAGQADQSDRGLSSAWCEGSALCPCECHPQGQAYRECQCNYMADGSGKTGCRRTVSLPVGLITTVERSVGRFVFGVGGRLS